MICSLQGDLHGAEKRGKCGDGYFFSYCSKLPDILQNFMLMALLRSFHTDAIYPLL